ncbi:2,3-bisphosphoglycerate-independent phosphoglycerate mutase [Nanobdella aerobiophila]|uniref:2,3-bisphosphoglycerate-independent phosphoglycerate mutase n=1 Tax=Nanobdella aerobiophila TaxID=2586965 RepID=A0A915SIV0_9ARCH|nr:2,3-bisphosphoglycerate-independent phosphoglycerate mutase [Nanobdella aerobiophila]BBL45902.1 2,3-bisphosphoglycerate-independent phosphoglycerate mutase [Nanobdella aerobiophila]
MVNGVFIILDGLGDQVNKQLNNKTPLEAAKKENIDKLIKYSEAGVLDTVGPGLVPGSDTGHLSLFGYEVEKYYRGRGIFEALGSDIELKEGDIAFRLDFSTVDNGVIIDRRIGRNDFGLEELLKDFESIKEKIEKEYGINIIIKHGVEHRGVLVIRGLESEKVTDNDLHEENVKVPKILYKEDKAKETAEVLNKLIQDFNSFANNNNINKMRKEKNIPVINYLLIRSASKYKELDKEDKFYNRYGVKSIFLANPPMYLGVAKYVGMDTYKPLGTNGTSNENLFSFSEAAVSLKEKYDIVFIHIKGTDSLSHDKKPLEKKKFIERIDRELIPKLVDNFDLILITGDHSTSSILGRHISDPVPVILNYENNRYGFVKNFSERKCVKGTLGRLKGTDIIKIYLDKLGKYIMYGS